jgi:hypothetical protein
LYTNRSAATAVVAAAAAGGLAFPSYSAHAKLFDKGCKASYILLCSPHCSPHSDLLVALTPGFVTMPAGHGVATAAAAVAASFRPPMQ